MRIKVAYIISNVNKALAFEWIAERLDKNRFELVFIVLNPKAGVPLEQFMRDKGISTYYLPLNGKKDLPGLVLKLRSILKKERPQWVHTHLLEASLAGLLAARLAGVKKRAYTRHHSTFHHEYHPKMVRWDKWNNRQATHIVAISDNVRQILVQKEGVPEGKITLVHHGFELERFAQRDEARVAAMRAKYGADGKHPVVGVIARQIEWKGIDYIIPAFQKILEQYPNACLLMANAKGPQKAKLHELLAPLPADSWKEIEFENDLYTLWHLFGLHIHTPINPEVEAFGQTYVEALAAGVPSIFTLSGVSREFIKHEQNALVVEFRNTEAIATAALRLLSDPQLRTSVTQQGLHDVQQFSIKNMMTGLETLYLQP